MQPQPTFTAKLTAFAGDIKISHTIFAMPWALLATFHAANGWPRLGQVLLILGCMITARTFAMGMNRLLDARLDALNPRTARRAIPSGRLPVGFAMTMTALSGLFFIACTNGFGLLYQNWIPLIASVPVLAFVAAYPLLKRFTRLCHYYLGAALALAPVCAWVAVAGNLTLIPLLMAGAVLLWTAGFDILYACQDVQSDLETGVFSVPSRLGVAGALWTARLTHLACVALLITLGYASIPLAGMYFVGVAISIALLVIEHAIVKPTDLSKLNLAFFTLNGVISLVLATCGIIDVLRAGH